MVMSIIFNKKYLLRTSYIIKEMEKKKVTSFSVSPWQHESMFPRGEIEVSDLKPKVTLTVS